MVIRATLFSACTSFSKRLLNLLEMFSEKVLGVKKIPVALGSKVQRTGNVKIHVRILGCDQCRQITAEDRWIVSTQQTNFFTPLP